RQPPVLRPPAGVRPAARADLLRLGGRRLERERGRPAPAGRRRRRRRGRGPRLPPRLRDRRAQAGLARRPGDRTVRRPRGPAPADGELARQGAAVRRHRRTRPRAALRPRRRRAADGRLQLDLRGARRRLPADPGASPPAQGAGDPGQPAGLARAGRRDRRGGHAGRRVLAPRPTPPHPPRTARDGRPRPPRRDSDLAPLLEGADVVFHLAAQPGVRLSWADFDEYASCNILATQRLLDAAKSRELRRLVYASSSSVYGNAADYPTAETAGTCPH